MVPERAGSRQPVFFRCTPTSEAAARKLDQRAASGAARSSVQRHRRRGVQSPPRPSKGSIMNKSELVHALAAVTETTQDSAAKSLEALLRIVSDELAKGGEVALAGFGSFRQAERSERAGRNPKTGEAI